MYEVIAGVYCSEGISYRSFGIRCGNLIFEDLSLDRQLVKQLAALFNREAVEHIHLRSLVEDFLAAPGDIQWDSEQEGW